MKADLRISLKNYRQRERKTFIYVDNRLEGNALEPLTQCWKESQPRVGWDFQLLRQECAVLVAQVVIVLIGIGALAFVLWTPQRNAQATLFEKYFNAFVAYTYVTSIPFFVALFQAFKLLGYVGRNEIFSLGSVRALRTIKYCALAIIGLVVVSVIFMISGDREDRPGGVFMRILVTFPSIVVTTTAAICERILQNAVDIKSEHDLTV